MYVRMYIDTSSLQDVALADGEYVVVAAADLFPISSDFFGASRDWSRRVHVHNAYGFGWRHPW